MNRRGFVSSLVSVPLALSADWAAAVDPNFAIKETRGINIDPAFGTQERQILRKALILFYSRFLQYYKPNGLLDWDTAFYHVLPGTLGQYEEGVDPADIFYDQWYRMYTHFIKGPWKFPALRLNKVVDTSASFVAQTRPNTIMLYPVGSSKSHEGSFDIDINDWYLNNAKMGQRSRDPNYFSGVIAHEAWHNLGHSHPKQDDRNYYRHQMIVMEGCIMRDANIQYGQNFEATLCRPKP
jgi:hypothetical protein